MRKSWFLVCFVNFFIASLMGLLLRWMYIKPIPAINFQYLMHGHSHVAMLGWVYLMLYCFIFYFFIPQESQQKTIYNRLFWLTELAVIGMMFDFPAQGYALVSIFFSTLHIFCSYYFCYLVWKDAKPRTFPEKRMLHTALFFMIFSTLGVWCLGPAVGLMGKSSAFYQIAIQFFLHFQFNGWFMFAILALFIKQSAIKIKEKKFRLFYNSFFSATFLTLALPISWFLPNPIYYWINAIGVILQFYSATLFFQLILPEFKKFSASLSTIEKGVYHFALFSLALKIILQMIVLVPEFATISHTIRNFVVGFIHLTMLGIITGFLLGFSLQTNLINSKKSIQKWGIIIFLLGITTTEILLLLQGIYLFLNKGILTSYYQSMFVFSICLASGILLLTTGIFKLKSKFI